MSEPQHEIAKRIQDWRRGTPRGPYTLELYPTLRCNLDCAFCDTTYRKKRAADELSRDRYLRLADEAAALDVRRCYILGGGEPMVAREITPDLMAKLKGHGIYGILGTNGTLFNEEILTRIVDMQWDELHFSLDGATPEINDRLRGQVGVFGRVTAVVRRLLELKKQRGSVLPRVLFHTVVTRLNYHQLADMVRLAHELGAFRVNFDAIVAYRPEQLALVITDEERIHVPAHARDGILAARTLNIENTLEQFLETRALERGAMTFSLNSIRDLFTSPCLNPWHHLVIHHNGRVSPCCVIPPEDDVDDLHHHSLSEIWFEGNTFNQLRRQFIEKEMTRHCPNCSMSIISQNDTVKSYLPPIPSTPLSWRV